MIDLNMRFPIEQADYSKTDSLLKINGQYLPKGACRDIQVQYEVEEFGENVRALDGGLLFLGMPGLGFRLNISMTGEGLFAPHLFSFRPWDRVEIESPEPLVMPGYFTADDLIRPHVPGSIRYMGVVQKGEDFVPRTIAVEGAAADPAILWTVWRPILIQAPESASYTGNEWSKDKSWQWNWREHLDRRDM